MDTIAGRQFGLVLLVAMLLVIFLTILRAKKWKLPYFRKLAALDAIEEAVGRAVEMGRPIHMSPGNDNLRAASSTEMLAGISVGAYVAELAAKYNVNLIPTVGYTDTQAQLEERIRLAFLQEGKLESYHIGMVRYVPYGMAYDLFVLGIAEREKPSANIMIGSWQAAGLYLIESMRKIGAINIAGTVRPILTAFFVGACDYALIGEEVLAAGAYTSKDAATMGGLQGQDLLKFFCSGLIIVGSILATIGIAPLLVHLLYW